MNFPASEIGCLNCVLTCSDFSDDRIVTLPYGIWQGAKRRQRLGSN
jgi:hypothetical protein